MPLTLPTGRNIQDASLSTTAAFPNANASTYSGALDLGQVTLGIVNEKLSVHIAVPNLANLVSAIASTLTLEHADVNLNANFATLTVPEVVTITGKSGNGYDAANFEIRVPGNTKQWLRLKGVGGANSGTTLTESVTLTIRT